MGSRAGRCEGDNPAKFHDVTLSVVFVANGSDSGDAVLEAHLRFIRVLPFVRRQLRLAVFENRAVQGPTVAYYSKQGLIRLLKISTAELSGFWLAQSLTGGIGLSALFSGIPPFKISILPQSRKCSFFKSIAIMVVDQMN